MGRKKTHEEFLEEVERLGDGEYQLTDYYINAQTKVLLKHVCGYDWRVTPHNFLRGRRCPNCSKTGLKNKNTDDFKREIFALCGNEYKLLSEYRNAKEKVDIKHIGCGEVFKISPTYFLGGGRCNYCSKKNKPKIRRYYSPKSKDELKKEKLTRDERLINNFKKIVKELTGNEYSVLSKVERTRTQIKIRIRHNECKNEWMVSSASFKKGSRCPNCRILYNQRTHQDYVNEVKKVNPKIKVLEKYIRSNVKIKHICECGEEWFVTPSGVLNGNSCTKCLSKKLAKIFSKTHEEFVREVYELVGNEYVVLGSYTNGKTPIKMKHATCNHVWNANPLSFLQGRRCPDCFGKIRKTQEEFEEEVFNLVGDEYSVLGEYINYNSPVRMKHNLCGYIWDGRPSSFIGSGSRCPECSIEKVASSRRKTDEQFVREVEDLVGSEYIFLDEYINSGTRLEVVHVKCGKTYEVTPSNFLRGHRCPVCAESKGEKRIREWLQTRGVDFEPQKEFEGLVGTRGGLLSYDFYLPDQNILIEYQGEFHDGSGRNKYTKINLERQREHDRRKREYAKSHDIKLIEIWYWDFDNIESILLQILTDAY